MDISNIYLKRKCFEIFAFKAELKLVDLEINKGIMDGYLMVLHGSVVELHVGGADQQELGQQGLSNLVGRDRSFIMLDLSDYVVSGSGVHDKLGTLG